MLAVDPWPPLVPFSPSGIPGISGWGGGEEYDKKKLYTLLNTTAFLDASSTWAEQRFYNELAIRALEDANHPLAAPVRQSVDALANVHAPDLSDFVALKSISEV